MKEKKAFWEFSLYSQLLKRPTGGQIVVKKKNRRDEEEVKAVCFWQKNEKKTQNLAETKELFPRRRFAGRRGERKRGKEQQSMERVQQEGLYTGTVLGRQGQLYIMGEREVDTIWGAVGHEGECLYMGTLLHSLKKENLPVTIEICTIWESGKGVYIWREHLITSNTSFLFKK